eukprot:Anaeramoba_ignava/c17887_g1_i1.p1 GENE.c17887_g1_i1~~c17887_g1_i1.p1  ORF type:complete len:408 (-),score=95.77 c17887_g1_i1:620-1843(-)
MFRIFNLRRNLKKKKITNSFFFLLMNYLLKKEIYQEWINLKIKGRSPTKMDCERIVATLKEKRNIMFDSEKLRTELRNILRILKKKNVQNKKDYLQNQTSLPFEESKSNYDLCEKENYSENQPNKRPRGRPKKKLQDCQFPEKKIKNMLKSYLDKEEIMEIINFIKSKSSLDEIIVNGFGHLLKQLPHNSPIRKPLICELVKQDINRDFSQREIAQRLDISEPTISRSIHQTDTSILWNIKYALQVSRSRTTEEEEERIRELWLEETQTDSGDHVDVNTDEEDENGDMQSIKVPRHNQKETDQIICERIRVQWKKESGIDRSLAFILVRKPKRVRKLKYFRCQDTCFCPLCAKNDQTHLEEVKHQRSVYIESKRIHDPERLFIVMDFGSFYPPNGKEKKKKTTKSLI